MSVSLHEYYPLEHPPEFKPHYNNRLTWTHFTNQNSIFLVNLILFVFTIINLILIFRFCNGIIFGQHAARNTSSSSFCRRQTPNYIKSNAIKASTIFSNYCNSLDIYNLASFFITKTQSIPPWTPLEPMITPCTLDQPNQFNGSDLTNHSLN